MAQPVKSIGKRCELTILVDGEYVQCPNQATHQCEDVIWHKHHRNICYEHIGGMCLAKANPQKPCVCGTLLCIACSHFGMRCAKCNGQSNTLTDLDIKYIPRHNAIVRYYNKREIPENVLSES